MGAFEERDVIARIDAALAHAELEREQLRQLKTVDYETNRYEPWNLSAIARQIPYQFALAYTLLAGLILLLSFTKESREPAPAHD